MQGVIFTQFADLVVEQWGMELWNELLEEAQLQHEGAFVGTQQYEDGDMIALVQALSNKVDIPVDNLLRIFGEYLFPKLIQWAPSVVLNITSFKHMLLNIDEIIHFEVRRLYPDAYVPLIESELVPEGVRLIYTSKRRLTPVLEGLIMGSANYYDQPCQIECTGIDEPKENSFTYLVRFNDE